MQDLTNEEFEVILRRDFLVEATEALDALEDRLLKLEKGPTDRGVLNDSFRIAHTVKGSSYAVGCDDIGQLAHHFEAHLQSLRDNKSTLSPRLFELFLKCIDRLRFLVKKHQGEEVPELDIAGLIKDLEEIGSSTQNPAPSTESSEAPSKTAEEQRKLEAVEALQEKASVQHGVDLPLKVLICDDEVEMLDLLETCLKLYNQNVTIWRSGDGVDGLKILEAQNPQLIISDIHMPNMDGVAFLRRLRELGYKMPVIFVSGFGDRNTLMELIHLGVVDFVEKPLDMDRLAIAFANAVKVAQIKEALLHLKGLNLRMYMSVVKLNQLIQEGKLREHEPLVKKVSDLIEEVTQWSDFALEK